MLLLSVLLSEFLFSCDPSYVEDIVDVGDSATVCYANDSVYNKIESIKKEVDSLYRSHDQYISNINDRLSELENYSNEIIWLKVSVVVIFLILVVVIVYLKRAYENSSSKPFSDEIGKIKQSLGDTDRKVNTMWNERTDKRDNKKRTKISSDYENSRRNETMTGFQSEYPQTENKQVGTSKHSHESTLPDHNETEMIYCIASSCDNVTVLEESDDRTQYLIYDKNNKKAKFKYCGTFDYLKDNSFILEDVCDRSGVLSKSQSIKSSTNGTCEFIGNGKWKITKKMQIELK